MIWMRWIGDGNWKIISSCLSWLRKLLPRNVSCRWSTVIAQLPAEHHGVVVEDMDYHAHLLVDHVRWKIVRIHMTKLYERKSVTMTICKSGAHQRYVLLASLSLFSAWSLHILSLLLHVFALLFAFSFLVFYMFFPCSVLHLHVFSRRANKRSNGWTQTDHNASKRLGSFAIVPQQFEQAE